MAEGKWKLHQLGKDRFQLRHVDTAEYTKVYKSKQEAMDVMNRIKPTLEYDKDGKLIPKIKPPKLTQEQKRIKRLETQPPGYAGSVQAQIDSASVYKKAPQFTPGDVIAKEDKAVQFETEADSLKNVKNVDNLLKQYSTLTEQIDLLESTEGQIADEKDIIPYNIAQKRLKDVKEALNKIIPGVKSYDKIPIKKKNPTRRDRMLWINKRTAELNTKYRAMLKNKEELPSHINPTSMTLDAKREAQVEWDQSQGEDISTMSDKDLIKQAIK